MKRLIIFLFIACGSLFVRAQKHAFANEVETIKAYDKQFRPTEHPILFVGSSSIRKWDSLQVVFGKYNVINRGIGGAVIDDIRYYLNDVIVPYQPRQIVLYVGENDVPNEKETADTILDKTVKLFREIRARLPAVPIVYISFKPSPSREKFIEKTAEANRLIRDFINKETNAVFVDIYTPMLTKNGKLRPELFVGDMLHMNKDGYAIWEKAVRKHLLKNK